MGSNTWPSHREATCSASPCPETLMIQFIKYTAAAVICAASLALAQQPARTFALKAESAHFRELIDRDAKLERVAGDFGLPKDRCGTPAAFCTSAMRSRTTSFACLRTA